MVLQGRGRAAFAIANGGRVWRAGENVAIEYRWAEDQTERLPAFTAELVRRPVAVIVAFGSPTALQAKAATTTIPIVCTIGDEPVRAI